MFGIIFKGGILKIMSKTKKTKNLLILIVLIAIVAIAVGYAAMAQNLTLNGTVNTLSAAEWNVHFVNGSSSCMWETKRASLSWS